MYPRLADACLAGYPCLKGDTVPGHLDGRVYCPHSIPAHFLLSERIKSFLSLLLYEWCLDPLPSILVSLIYSQWDSPVASTLCNSLPTRKAKVQGTWTGSTGCFHDLTDESTDIECGHIKACDWSSAFPFTLTQDRNVCHFEPTIPGFGPSLPKQQTNPNNKIHSQSSHVAFQSCL